MCSDLQVLETLKGWDLNTDFVVPSLWLPHRYQYAKTPLVAYFPLHEIRSLFQLFQMDKVHDVLERLDFRKRAVKRLGSRETWRVRLAWEEQTGNIEFLGLFFMFYESVYRDPHNIRPLWRCFKY